MTNKHKAWIAVAATVALLMGGLGIVGISAAQNAATTNRPAAPSDPRGLPNRPGEMRPGAPGKSGRPGGDPSTTPRIQMTKKAEAIAGELGIGADAVRSALESHRRDFPALVQALVQASGKDEAAVRAVLNKQMPDRMLDRAAEIAKALGLDEATVTEILTKNRGDHDATVTALASASGKDAAAVTEALQAVAGPRGADGTGPRGGAATPGGGAGGGMGGPGDWSKAPKGGRR